MFEFITQKLSLFVTSFSSKKKLDEQSLQEALVVVEDSLLQADVPYQVVKDFIASVRQEVDGNALLTKVNAGQLFTKIVHDQVRKFLGDRNDFTGFILPSVVMMMGLQGSGKTTSLAKLAWYACMQAEQRGKKRTILCASVDFYRPAAVEQLAVLAKSIDMTMYRSPFTDPVQAACDSVEAMKKGGYDLLFLDTAGRLHVDNAMVQELREIDARIKPRYKIFVLDAMVGQESLNIAQTFDASVGFHAAMLSKTDSDSRGGAAFAFKYSIKKPILFIGTGEKVRDIEVFHPDRMAKRILGMGDVVSLAEKAEQIIKQDDRASLNRTFRQGSLTLQDFADQMAMVDKIGSLKTLSSYLPGVGPQLTPEMIEKGDHEIKRFKAIICSMTPRERIVPKILTPSRIERIARGAGVLATDVAMLLRRFEESQQYAKLFKRFFRSK
jgi:signal recognition particle subunit SRP54